MSEEIEKEVKEDAKSTIEPIEQVLVTSSNVKSAGFDPVNGRIHVTFNNGGCYAYDDCTQAHFDALMKADATPNQSVGSYIHANLRQKKFTKL